MSLTVLIYNELSWFVRLAHPDTLDTTNQAVRPVTRLRELGAHCASFIWIPRSRGTNDQQSIGCRCNSAEHLF
ncbi:MAG TPA: hypothetical protein VMD56_13630 [Steroidobacteraceae bacterium]|nr:hypothetical protein [Steroidobacteraceae bacterium]